MNQDQSSDTTDANAVAKPTFTVRRDNAWPGGLDLHNLHNAIAGCVAVIAALQDAAEHSETEPGAFEPLIMTLQPWRVRIAAARDEIDAGSAS